MKHGKKLTRKQRLIIHGSGLDPRSWLVVKNLPDRFVLVNKRTGTMTEVDKPPGRKVITNA